MRVAPIVRYVPMLAMQFAGVSQEWSVGDFRVARLATPEVRPRHASYIDIRLSETFPNLDRA